MKRKILILILTLSFINVKAQLFKNDINVYLGVDYGTFYGSKILDQDNFISPALAANYRNTKGLSFKAFKNGKLYSIGLGFDFMMSDQWELFGYYDYEYSQLDQYILSPTIRFHNPFKENGIFNRFKFVLEVSPTIGLANLSLNFPLFYIENEYNDIVTHSLKSSDLMFGFKGSAGFEYALNNFAGLYLNYAISHNWVNSKFYNENSFSSSMLTVGFFVRLKKDKHLYY